jgi:hypothetical protein
MVLLTVGYLAVKQCPLVEEIKTEKILKQVIRQERESKVILKLFEIHTQKISEVKKEIKEFGVKLN